MNNGINMCFGLWHSVVLCVVPGKVEGHLVTEGWSGVIHL